MQTDHGFPQVWIRLPLITYTLMNALNGDPLPSMAERLAACATVGSGLVRPECVLATAAGDVFTADWRGGVVHLTPDHRQLLYAGPGPDGLALKPNGIALLKDGSFLLAHLGADSGGVFRLQRNGQVTPWLMAVDGVDLPPTNFVVEDRRHRFWVTVSTRCQPRALGYRPDVADGFIVRVDDRGASIVADGLGYTNEVAVDPTGAWLYVNETFARRLSRFALRADGSLGDKQVVCTFGEGTFPDGLAFDECGSAWVVSIVSNRLIRVAPDGSQQIWLEDADPAHLAWVEAAYRRGGMGRPHLDDVVSTRLRNVSSIAFCGPARRQALLGCLLGKHLVRLDMPAPGLAPTHWHYPQP